MKKKDIAIAAIAGAGVFLLIAGIPFAAFVARVIKANSPEAPITTNADTTVIDGLTDVNADRSTPPTVNADKTTETYYCNEPLWSILPTEVRYEDSDETEFLKFTQDLAVAMGFDPENAAIDKWGVGYIEGSDIQIFRSCDIPSEYEYEGDPLFLVSYEYLDGGELVKDFRRTFFYSSDFKFVVALNGSYVRSYWGEFYTEDYIMEIYNRCEPLLARGSEEPATPQGAPKLLIGEPIMFDVTGDGVEDAVTGSMYGSGMVRTILHVRDGVTDELYVLDGYNYSYFAEGVEDGRLIVVMAGPYGYGDPVKEIQGTVVLENGLLIFVADDNTIMEDTAAIFEGAEDIAVTDEDFVFEYDGHTFSIDNDWHDYIDILDYPEEYEANNYGFVSSYSNGLWWKLQYPSSGDSDWYFAVTLVSPSREREGTDTEVDYIALDMTPTARGVAGGDPAESLVSLYGAPDRIEYFGENAELVWVIYEGMKGEICFAINNEGIIEYSVLRGK